MGVGALGIGSPVLAILIILTSKELINLDCSCAKPLMEEIQCLLSHPPFKAMFHATLTMLD